MKYLKSLLIIFAATILISCSEDSGPDSGNDGKSYIYPEDGTDWAAADPAKYQFDETKFEAITDYVSTTDLTCMMVIAGGEQIYKYGYATEVSYIASCRKSVLAMLYGKYVENGTINMYQTVEELIAEGIPEDVGGLYDSEKEATVLDLLTCRSGVYHPASNAGDSSDKPERGTKRHGTHYVYNNWDFNLAGTVLEHKVKGSFFGKEVYDILQSDLAHPIGMADWDIGRQKYGGNWKMSESGKEPVSYYPAYHIYISTRDMARIGYLMLRKGKWKDKQVISEKWAEKIVTPYSDFNEVNPSGSGQFCYGYMWWIFDQHYYENNAAYEGAYMARGSGGQFILVMPKLDLVVAWKTNTSGGKSTSISNFWKAMSLLLDAYTGNIEVNDTDIQVNDGLEGTDDL